MRPVLHDGASISSFEADRRAQELRRVRAAGGRGTSVRRLTGCADQPRNQIADRARQTASITLPRMSLLPALTGSFSTPAAGNPTVAIMEAAYHHHDIDARYLNCDVAAEHLADAVRGATAMGWIGFNCSLPHKVAVIELMDELADSARLIVCGELRHRSNGRWIRGKHRRSGLPGLVAFRCRPSGPTTPSSWGLEALRGRSLSARARRLFRDLGSKPQRQQGIRYCEVGELRDVQRLLRHRVASKPRSPRGRPPLSSTRPRWDCPAREVRLDFDAIPAGLVVCDVISQSARHPFPAAGAAGWCDDRRRPRHAAQSG